MTLYWSPKKLPELSEIPESLRHGAWRTAKRRAHAHWQIWACYVAVIAGIYLVPRWDVHVGRFAVNVAATVYLFAGAAVCQVVTIHFARRYLNA